MLRHLFVAARTFTITAAAVTMAAGMTGCRGPTGPDQLAVAGQYELYDVDGAADSVVNCCSGLMEIGLDVPAGRYIVSVSTPPADSFSSYGTYWWDGSTLTLTDSATAAKMTGSVLESQAVIRRGAHSYQFFRLPTFPGLNASAGWVKP